MYTDAICVMRGGVRWNLELMMENILLQYSLNQGDDGLFLFVADFPHRISSKYLLLRSPPAFQAPAARAELWLCCALIPRSIRKKRKLHCPQLLPPLLPLLPALVGEVLRAKWTQRRRALYLRKTWKKCCFSSQVGAGPFRHIDLQHLQHHQHGKKAKMLLDILDWPLLLRPLPFAPPHCSHLKGSGLPVQQFNYSNSTVPLLHINPY